MKYYWNRLNVIWKMVLPTLVLVAMFLNSLLSAESGTGNRHSNITLSEDYKVIYKTERLAKEPVYNIQEWQKWAQKNKKQAIKQPIIIAGRELEPSDFITFSAVSVEPKNSITIIALNSIEISLSSVSLIGVLDLNARSVEMMPDVLYGDVENILISSNGDYFAGTIGAARSSQAELFIGDLSKKEITILKSETIRKELKSKSNHFIAMFRKIEFSDDNNTIYFITNGEIENSEIKWAIKANGAGLVIQK